MRACPVSSLQSSGSWRRRVPHQTPWKSLLFTSPPGSAVSLMASGRKKKTHMILEYTKYRRSRARYLQRMHCLLNLQSSVSPPLRKPVVFLRRAQQSPASNSPSRFKACQLRSSYVSGINRQGPISLPSLPLTAPCNHLFAISNISDDR